MRVVAFAPMYDKPGRKDATTVFQPAAKKFLQICGGKDSVLKLIDNRASAGDMRDSVLSTLLHAGRLVQCVAFFCHGLNSRTIQFGFNVGNVSRLAIAIHNASSNDVVVPLYCCMLAGGKGVGGDGGFADELRDALCRHGATDCRVMGHTTAGHAVQNPYARFCDGQGSPVGGIGGQWIVAPKSELWKKWVAALRKKNDSFKYNFPLMSIATIHAFLTR